MVPLLHLGREKTTGGRIREIICSVISSQVVANIERHSMMFFIDLGCEVLLVDSAL